MTCTSLQLAAARRYREANGEKLRARGLAWYHKNKVLVGKTPYTETERKERKKVSSLAHRKRNRVKYCDRELVRRHGLTRAEYDKKLEAQNGLCASCGSSHPGGHGRFHVDHDHITGRQRGLLCSNCNLGLGHFKDNPYRLIQAINYLEKWTANEDTFYRFGNRPNNGLRLGVIQAKHKH